MVGEQGTTLHSSKGFGTVNTLNSCGILYQPSAESILRLDQLQPIGAHYKSHRVTEFRLSDDALSVVDELIQWLVWGGVPEGGHIAAYREIIEDTFPK